MRHKGLISVEEGDSKHPSARPVKRTLVKMQGLTATDKVTRTRYKKVGNKFVPVAIDGLAFKRSDDETLGVEEFSAADYYEEFGEDVEMDGEFKHQLQMMNDGMLDDEDWGIDSSPFIG